MEFCCNILMVSFDFFLRNIIQVLDLRIPRKIVQTDFPFESVTRNTAHSQNCEKKLIKVL